MSKQDPRIPDSQVNQALEDSIVTLDRSRAQGLNELTALESAKYAVMQRDRARLVAKFGEDDPRVTALDEALALHRERVTVYQAEILGATATIPKVDDHSWAIHGHVLDAKLQPVEGITVALFSGDTWERSLASACTDAKGHFQLGPKPVKEENRSLSLKASQKEKVIYTDPAPVAVAAGRLEYRRVILNDRNQASCDSPPDTKPRRTK